LADSGESVMTTATW